MFGKKLFAYPSPQKHFLSVFNHYQNPSDMTSIALKWRRSILRVTFKLYALRAYAGPCCQEIVGTLRTARAKVFSDVLFLYALPHFIQFMRFNAFCTKWLHIKHYGLKLGGPFSKSLSASSSPPGILEITISCPKNTGTCYFWEKKNPAWVFYAPDLRIGFLRTRPQSGNKFPLYALRNPLPHIITYPLYATRSKSQLIMD